MNLDLASHWVVLPWYLLLNSEVDELDIFINYFNNGAADPRHVEDGNYRIFLETLTADN